MTTETPQRPPERPTGAGQPLHDPFAGRDLDQEPDAVFQALGVTREEIRRAREAPPAVEHGRGTEAAAPAASEGSGS